VPERARPLLGTVVSIRADGVPDAAAHSAIDDAFAAIDAIHRRMSFHDPDSDVARLNRDAARIAVKVDADTWRVLRWSREFAAHSRGAFDVSVAEALCARGVLPRPPGLPAPGGGTWRDIELRDDGTVRFRRPLIVDLGGVAKGYAVDRAIDRLRANGVSRGCVNAGGDLRVLGTTTERIRLRTRARRADVVPVLDVAGASVASSSGRGVPVGHSPHVDPRTSVVVGTRHFVAVVARRCVVADALTKVVLVLGGRSDRVLRRYGATAYVETRGQWRTLGASN
jgi:thiamine biosynthesis lipoprotein